METVSSTATQAAIEDPDEEDLRPHLQVIPGGAGSPDDDGNDVQLASDHLNKDDVDNPDTEAEVDETTTRLQALHKRFGRGAAIRAATEVVGMGVDAALMGAGSAGVGLMQNVAYREIAATAPEVAVLDKLLHHHDHEKDELAGVKKVLKKMGGVALGVTVAVIAQKAGVGVVEHIHDSLNHGAGHIAVPLTSKVGAMTGVSAVQRSIGRHL